MTFIPVIIGALGTVTEGLLQGLKDLEIRGRMETIQTATFMRWTRPNNCQQQKKKKKKKKWTCLIVEFAVPADHRVKMKKSEKEG